MQRKSLTKLLLVLMGLVLGALAWLILQTPEVANPPREKQISSTSRPLTISGLSYTATKKGVPTSRIRVARMQVRPRRFGALRIRSLNELALTDARFELLQNLPEKPGEKMTGSPVLSLETGLADSVQGLAGLQGMGNISRTWVDGMTLVVFRDQKPYLTIRSQSAQLDFKKRQTEFNRAILTARNGQYRLTTEKLVWDEQNKIFLIPKDYRIRTDKELLVGHLARLTADLHLQIPPGGTAPKVTPFHLPQTSSF